MRGGSEPTGPLGLGPRVVVAGTRSGDGKTTVATGLMAALRGAGRKVAGAKVGPDFIDPGYHEVATGRPGRNLDVFCQGADAVPGLAARAASGADLLVVEGVMGLFDGEGATDVSSTAHVAALLDAPVLLVVDSSSLSGSVAALVRGYDDSFHDTAGRGLSGVVLNRVGSDTHEALLREALCGLTERGGPPVVGALRRDRSFEWRGRHLGLVPVAEQRGDVSASVRRLGETIARSLDLEAIERLARGAPLVRADAPRPAHRVVATPVPVAIASGPAFSFVYRDNLERLEEAGAELLPFDPFEAPALPSGARGLYAGGGFPEVYAAALSANAGLLRDVRAALRGGLVTWAECGGMLWLCRSVNGSPMSGALPAQATTRDRVTVGYRRAEVRRDNPVAPKGATLRGHEHHYSLVDPPGDALSLQGVRSGRPDGWASPTMLATYLHLHLGADPAPAERFVATAARRSVERAAAGSTA